MKIFVPLINRKNEETGYAGFIKTNKIKWRSYIFARFIRLNPGIVL